MASKYPSVKNSAYIYRCVLFAQSDNQIKSNPTLAAGDWKVSIDGGAFANLTTLPDVDPDSTVQVKVSLSADEMNGDEIMVTAIDAAGDEWHSAAWVIHTAGQTLDTMDGNIDSILADTGTDGVKIAADAITASVYDESTAFPLKSADTGSTAVARTGADSDTLETLSDEIAAIPTTTLSAADVRTAVGLASANLDTQIADLPTNAELTSALAAADDAVLAAIAALNDIDTTEAQAAAAAALAAYDAATGSDVTSATSGLATSASIAALNDLSAAEVNAEVVDVVRTDTLPDSYAADGAQPTVAQALLAIHQFLQERAVSGTTMTVKKPDGSTSAMTFTLDDASNPTSITRAS